MKRLINKFILHLRQKGAMKTSATGPLQYSPENGTQGASVSRQQPSGTNITAAKWDKSDTAYSTEGFKEYWELLEDVQRYQATMMAKGKDIFEYIASFLPKDKVLSNLNGLIIGCMHGEETPAVSLARTGAFRELTIIDIADGLLRNQERITEKMRMNHILKYKCMDLNTDSITERDTYDFIFSVGTIHHIERLEGLFEEINNALRNDGIFAMREYIGPCYLQATDKQLRIADTILQCLPDYLKMQKNGIIKHKAWKPSKEEIIADDPSEALRSEDIMSVVQNSLEALTINMTGGTLLNSLLHGIAGNFEKGESERAVLKTIIAFERTLVEEGVLPSDYVFLVAKKKLCR